MQHMQHHSEQLNHLTGGMQILCRWRECTWEGLTQLPPDEAQLATDTPELCLVQSVSMTETQTGTTEVFVVGDPCSDAVILVRRTAGLFCLSCSAQKTCRHVKAVQGDIQTAADWNEAQQDAWTQRFEARFDRSTGQRCVTSCSQVHIREAHP